MMSVGHQTDITSVSEWGQQPADAEASETPAVLPLPVGEVTPSDLRVLGHCDRSAFLRRVERDCGTADIIRTTRCPICGRHRDDWDEDRTAAHFGREDHDWSALEAAREQWREHRDGGVTEESESGHGTSNTITTHSET